MAIFENPPINELVLDIQFQPLHNFGTADIGGVRELFIKEFPKYSEQLPLPEDIERYDATSFMQFGLGPQIPPIRRQWFQSDTGNRLVQFQPNRFIHNWRRLEEHLGEKNNYPSFDSEFPSFVKHLASLNSYCEKQHGGSLKPVHWEVTKFNFIPLADDWQSDLNRVFTFCFDIDYGKDIKTEALSYSKKSILNSQDKPIGRFYVQLDVTDYQPNKKAAVVRFSARGHAEKFSLAYCLEKMTASNKIINEAFVASTKKDVRKDRWGEK